LGIEEEATLEQVKAAYRKMVLKFHPDKRGADVSTEEANVKFLQVQRAFGIIKEQRK
jgi:DnaJ family protein C protein 9